MKNKFIYIVTVFFACLLSFGCRTDNKKESRKIKIMKSEIKKTLSTDSSESIDNVSVIIYGPYNNRIGFSSLNGYIINVKKNTSYIKYATSKHSNLSRNSMNDSISISKSDNTNILNFFLVKNKALKETYWDSVSEGRTRKIYFLNHNKAVVKYISIIGEPRNIDYLKESCDFLFEKVRITDSIRSIRK